VPARSVSAVSAVSPSGPRAAVSPNGRAASLSFAAGGESGVVSFMALAGQQVTVAASHGTFAALCGVVLHVVAPNGSRVNHPVCAGRAASVGPVTLVLDGTYKVKLIAGATATGSLRVAVTSTGPIASITPDARKVRMSIDAPNQVVQLGFLAKAGERYSAIATDDNVAPRCRVAMSIADGDGKSLDGRNCIGAPSFDFVETAVIPTDGIYYLRAVERDGSDTPASFDVKVFRVVDINHPITADGTPETLTIRTPGQRGIYHFDGTAGQVVSVVLPNYQIGDDLCQFALIRPDGTRLTGTACYAITPSFIDATALDVTGSWTLVIDPYRDGPWVGTMTVEVFTVTDVDEPITVGTPLQVTITTPGQNALLRFTGAVDDRLTIDVTNIDMSDGLFDLTIRKPDGFTLDGVEHGYIGAHFDMTPLDEAGTYSITVNPEWAQTGTVQVTLTPTP
jgi:hypothetical protein